MSKVLVNIAWPYANGPIHLGHVAGSLLPPDIFARYNRLLGNEVWVVGGSDQHGTPITVTADKEGVTLEDRSILRSCMEQLRDEERQIVTLHALSGFKHREIAAILQLPLPTVLSKYHRAVKRLKQHLQ